MGVPKKQFVLYCLGHFWIDFSCALQMPIGLLADRLSRNSCVAALVAVVVIVTVVLVRKLPKRREAHQQDEEDTESDV